MEGGRPAAPHLTGGPCHPVPPTGYIQKIKSGEEDFESLASQFSDCSSAKARGDLGAFSRGGQGARRRLQPPGVAGAPVGPALCRAASHGHQVAAVCLSGLGGDLAGAAGRGARWRGRGAEPCPVSSPPGSWSVSAPWSASRARQGGPVCLSVTSPPDGESRGPQNLPLHPQTWGNHCGRRQSQKGSPDSRPVLPGQRNLGGQGDPLPPSPTSGPAEARGAQAVQLLRRESQEGGPGDRRWPWQDRAQERSPSPTRASERTAVGWRSRSAAIPHAVPGLPRASLMALPPPAAAAEPLTGP